MSFRQPLSGVTSRSLSSPPHLPFLLSPGPEFLKEGGQASTKPRHRPDSWASSRSVVSAPRRASWAARPRLWAQNASDFSVPPQSPLLLWEQVTALLLCPSTGSTPGFVYLFVYLYLILPACLRQRIDSKDRMRASLAVGSCALPAPRALLVNAKTQTMLVGAAAG